MIDVHRLSLPITAASSNRLRHCRIVFALALCKERRDEDHMVCIDEIAVGYISVWSTKVRCITYAPAADSLARFNTRTFFFFWGSTFVLKSSRIFAAPNLRVLNEW
jgi:hypothetical protein